MIDPEDRVHVPAIGLIVAAIVALAFVVGAFDALLANHFTSWHLLTLRPSTEPARTIDALTPAVRWLAMAGAGVFGATTVRRSAAQGLRVGLVRLVVVGFAPIIIEVLDFGTQDGTVPDLESLPIHSMALLAIVVFLPSALAARDWHLLRTRLRAAE